MWAVVYELCDTDKPVARTASLYWGCAIQPAGMFLTSVNKTDPRDYTLVLVAIAVCSVS